MYYDAIRNDHGLPHDPFKALVAPRPIGWISTIDRQGRPNLAPYSFFNAVCERPHMVMVSSSGHKHTIANIEATGEFVCNVATYGLREAMNLTSAPLADGQSEFEFAGLTPVPSVAVAPPRVGEAPAALECRLLKTVPLTDLDGRAVDQYMAIGIVVGIHIDDGALVDGLFDTANIQPLARLGYFDFAAANAGALFTMRRPRGGGNGA